MNDRLKRYHSRTRLLQFSLLKSDVRFIFASLQIRKGGEPRVKMDSNLHKRTVLFKIRVFKRERDHKGQIKVRQMNKMTCFLLRKS